MANLIGYLTAQRRSEKHEVSRLADGYIVAQLETWHGSIKVMLDKDGEYYVAIGPKGKPNAELVSGKIPAGPKPK